MKNKGLGDVLEMSDHDIENNDTLDTLYAKVDEFIENITF